MKNQAIIDLEKIKENIKTIKGAIDKKTKICAVVKDDAYGHGLVKVSSAVYPYCDYYAVSLVEEGIELRQGGIDKDILVLTEPFNSDLERAILYGLTLSVSSLTGFKEINEVSKRLGKITKVHIQFDSGMNRCGTNSLEEIESIMKESLISKNIKVSGIYSHLFSPKIKKRVKKQVNKFLLAINICKSYNKEVIAHISASGGMLKGEYFDMVRVGLLLYGYKPFNTRLKVEKAMRVEIPVIKKVSLKPFSGALYGYKRTFFPRKLALVRLGYGDGVPRKKVKGQFSIKCMDLSLVDEKLTENGKLILSDFDLEAKKYKTISYEIMVNISKRCEKIYKE